jgi:D-alanine-D-alanine ligase-like ATP-grasp enzyme
MIKLKCKKCLYQYEITEAELIDNGELHTHCLLCGGENEVLNLGEIVEKDFYQRAENYLNKWFKEIGIEATLEMIERNKNQACYRIYKEILEKRGFKIK